VTQVDFNLYGISQVAESSGFFDANVDPDGVIRSTQLVKLTEAGFFPSLALAQASMILGEKPDVLFDGTGAVGTIRFNNKNLNVPVTPSGAAEINFRGRDQFVYLSAKDLLEATRPHEFEQRQNMLVELKQKLQTAQTEGNRSPASDELQKQVETLEKEQAVNRTKIERIQAALKDSAVIIGVTAIGAFDMRTFPYGSNIPGVEGHANILENILSGTLLEHGSSRLGTIVIFLLMTVGTLLFAYAAEKFEAVPALLLFVAVTLGLGFTDIKILFETYNQNWNTGFFTLEVLTVFVLTLALKYVTEEKNKKFVKGAFAKYVSPSIIDDIMADPTKLRVGGERRDLTIVFSDIRSFTSFSENMEATRLAKFLNDYLGLMTEIVFECQGTLDKYIGDAVMAFWGAPTPQPGHAGNAIRAAIRMQQVLNEHHARYQSQYGVDVQVGIGINSGPVNVGNMGSERIFEYTVIGDHVNLASRVEGLTKTYGVKILATRFTLDEMEKFGEVPPAHRSLDFVKVKGKKQAVELIQIFEKEPSPLALARFGKGRNHYARQEWDLAIEEFQITKNLMGGSDGPSQMYIERCEEFKKNPPELDWHGEWEMHSK
jgi:adenylate cyclase